MRPHAMITLALAAAAFAQAPAASPKPAAKPIPPSYKALRFPPLNQIKVPEPARVELANGMVVYLVEDHELPMITAQALVRTGSRWEPAGKTGLAAITGAVMRTGGTQSRNGDKLDEELDRLGAVVETSIGEASGNATVSVLKEDIDKGLDILADVLQHPAFPEDKIDLEKVQQREGIARRNDDPGDIANREFRRLVYGKDSPYGRIPEYATIDAISRADLVAFHQQFFQPENIILGVWGDFNAAEMRARIEKTFGRWKRGGRPVPPAPPVQGEKIAGLHAIQKDDVNQSTVVMGYLGGKRNDPDYFSLEVMNAVLGSGFASRLFSQVRSQEGLSYSVYSGWDAGWDRPGMFFAGGGTKSQNTVKLIQAIRKQIEGMTQGEVTDAELQRAKDSILKGFAFEFDSTGKIVGRLMTYEYYGYPKDYLQQYQANIAKVTKADVARVAKQHLRPADLAIVVLGNQKDFGTPLTTLGSVAAIDIAIPQPKQAALAAATPEAIEKGRALLAAARKAHGGDAVANIRDYTTAAEASIETPQGAIGIKMEMTSNLSGKIVQKMVTPMGEMTTGYDGQAGWMRMGANTRDLPAAQASEISASFFRDTFSLLQNFDKYTVQAVGENAVAVSDRGLQITLHLDPKTNLVARKVYTAAVMGPPAEMEEALSDYRDVAGVKVPFQTVVTRAGKKFSEAKISDFKINPGVPDSAYRKP